MSSKNEIYMDQRESRVGVSGRGVAPPAPFPLSMKQISGQILKDGVNGISSTSGLAPVTFPFKKTNKLWKENFKKLDFYYFYFLS